MARSVTSKVKIDRDRKNTIATTIPVAHDIVAGKFTDHDWLWMLDRDDSDSFIVDLVNDIYGAADKIIYDKYIDNQLIPYTVLQVKDALLQIVEWQFLARDDETDPTFWIQDTEARTAVTDCWAQGAVPLTFRSPASITEELENPSSPRKSPQSPRIGVDGMVCSPRSDVEGSKVSDNICSPVRFEQNEVCATEPETCDRPCQSKAQSSICEDEVPFKMPEPPEFACDNIAKQTTVAKKSSCRKAPVEKQKHDVSVHDVAEEDSGQQPETKSELSVTNDECNKAFPWKGVKCEDICIDAYIAKIPASRLPSNRVNTVYCIIDPKQEAALVRSEALRARKKIPLGERPPVPKTSTGHNLSVAKVKATDVTDVTLRDAQPETRFPLLLDSMQIAPGVTARERDVVKRGPKIDSSRGDVPSDLVLRPVRSHNPHPTVNVSDLLDQHICVKPIAEPSLVPPIVATSH